ncbi:MAG: hypothetical protein RBR16_03455 [Syntrophus sp. (in: bacteria)]|nr:hypothetical protein [Syntrophus sp. (in: bacteria)]
MGFAFVIAVQYDPVETGKLFLRLKEDVEECKIDEPFFFGSHPRLQERTENYEKRMSRRSKPSAGVLGFSGHENREQGYRSRRSGHFRNRIQPLTSNPFLLIISGFQLFNKVI